MIQFGWFQLRISVELELCDRKEWTYHRIKDQQPYSYIPSQTRLWGDDNNKAFVPEEDDTYFYLNQLMIYLITKMPNCLLNM